MKKSRNTGPTGLTRRNLLKLSGLAVGGLALTGSVAPDAMAGEVVDKWAGNRNSFFDRLPVFHPARESLAKNEMRITFLGTWFCPRLAQECNSVFVEVGGGPNGRAADQFVFDCGSGVMAKYNAMGIPLSRMDKIFLTHLHGDHMSDLTHIYTFGPAYDRKKPLYVWGPSKSELTFVDPDGVQIGPFNDGTADYCNLLRESVRWHTESFSFQSTALENFSPPTWKIPSAPVDKKDAYDLVPFELDWKTRSGVAYQNDETGVKITHFPAVHARQGSISYKLEWRGLSMIFTGDTKPNNYVVEHATDGVDVLIHEMTPTPEVWVEKFVGIPEDNPLYPMVLADVENVQASSHTQQKEFGYILSLLGVRPRLAVGTHFPATNDTIRAALADIRQYYPKGALAVASDLMVISVTKNRIQRKRAVVSDYTWAPTSRSVLVQSYDTPKYWKYDVNDKGETIKVGDPYAQLDPDADVIVMPGKKK